MNVSYQCGMFLLFRLYECCCSKPPFASSLIMVMGLLCWHGTSGNKYYSNTNTF